MPLSLAGTLKDPYGKPLPSAVIRFDAVVTSNDVLNHISAEATTDATGAYAIQVEFGRYDIRVKDGRSFYDLARNVQINTDTTAATLNDLIVAAQGYDSLTPQIILDFQALRDETLGYRDEADASATAAATSEANADQSEAAALASQQAAATSETNAANSATAAATSESNAAASENAAAGSASAAAASEANAAASETSAGDSASAAATSEANAAGSATSAQAALDEFQSVYYGALASDPATDPNGNPPSVGDRYYNTTSGGERVFDGAGWVANDVVLHEQAADPHPQYLTTAEVQAHEALRDSATLNLNFARGRYLVDDGELTETTNAQELLTVERATPKWVEGPNGKLREVPPNVIAREWRNGQPQGALIEESRTNSVLYSEPDGTNWPITNNASHWAGQLITKGGVTLDTYIDDVFRRNSVPCTTGCAFSFFIYDDGTKGGLGSVVAAQLRLFQTGSVIISALVHYDYSTGVVSLPDGINAEAREVSSGLFRISVVLEDANADECAFALTGEVTIGAIQMEVDASTPSSYIPTTDSPVTRATDNVSRVLGSEFRSDEGTFFVSHAGFGMERAMFFSVGNSASSYMALGYNASILGYFEPYGPLLGRAVDTTQPQKWAITYAVNSPSEARIGVYIDGTQRFDEVCAFDTATIADWTKMGLGSRFDGDYRTDFAALKDVTYYPRALSEAELIELTGASS